MPPDETPPTTPPSLALVGRRSAAERFAALTAPAPGAEGCLLWRGQTRRGQPTFKVANVPGGIWDARRVAYVLEHAEPLLPAQRLEHTCPTKNCVNGAHYVIGRKTRKVGKKPTRIPRATKVVAAVALVRGVEPEAIAAGLGITKRQVRDAVQFVNRQLQRGKTVPELADYGFSTTTTRVLRQPPTTTSNGAHHRE